MMRIKWYLKNILKKNKDLVVFLDSLLVSIISNGCIAQYEFNNSTRLYKKNLEIPVAITLCESKVFIKY